MHQFRLLRSRRLGIYTTGPLCEYMTPSTKPEVHNVSQRRQRRGGPSHSRRQHAETIWRCSAVWFISEMCECTAKLETVKQTYSFSRPRLLNFKPSFSLLLISSIKILKSRIERAGNKPFRCFYTGLLYCIHLFSSTLYSCKRV